jgi:hypothetical protein
MAATKSDIRHWLERADKECTHMIVVCDTFDYDDYPVYVYPHENVRVKEAEYNGKNMARVMEVYNLKMDIEKQLAEHRSFNY